jgi:glycosyltransferase involved in cell wall biosynthesis
MSCGTPVVCFNATGPKDIVEHRACGYLAEPFNPLDLAQGIRWVLEQPTETYAELCRNARVRAQQCFDSRVIAKTYLALYRDILRGAEA